MRLYCSYAQWLARGIYLEELEMSAPGLLAMTVQLLVSLCARSASQKSPRRLLHTAAALKPPARLWPGRLWPNLRITLLLGQPIVEIQLNLVEEASRAPGSPMVARRQQKQTASSPRQNLRMFKF